MKKIYNTIRDIWSIEELRNKLILTLGFMAVYRFFAQVSLPWIDAAQLGASATANQGGLLGVINAFTGGAFSSASIMALGVMPYISASIVVQLMGIAVPYLQKLDKDGQSGQNKKTQITRWLTILITLVQGPAYILNMKSLGIPESAFLADPSSMKFLIPAVTLLTAGSIFAMWLGEKITDKGIGNGISLLIMIGIIARFPSSFIQEVMTKLDAGSGAMIMILLEIVVWFLVILLSVYLVTAVRRVTVQYAKRSVIGEIKSVGNTRDYLPLRLNSAGVMPIIFAQALMFVPALLAQSGNETVSSIGTSFQDMFGLEYNILFAILIIIFSFFYTAITIPTNKMADDLKRQNGFIPGVKPGHDTAELLDSILSRITFPGSIYLALLSVLPAFVVMFGVTQNWALFYGGTSLIIMVGVAIDSIQQINAYLLNHHYDGLMKTSTGRRAK